MTNTTKTGGALSVTCPTCGRLNGQVCKTSSGKALFGKPHARRRALAFSTDTANKPLAAHGLKSYRYKGRHGFIMIGAHDDADALNEARRSLDDMRPPRLGLLEAWDGSRYVSRLGEAVRLLAAGETISADDYTDARDHAATTGNDRDALLRIMYGSPIHGDRDRLRDLATEIENTKE
jgi:hypothetical protein